jgi:hypothetical protein
MSNASSNNYSSDSDSSSDDEYLTGKHEIQGDEGEREAIISRKLLDCSGGKYRLAAKSHASHILSKHSSGFESLGRIETERNKIMSRILNTSWRLGITI